MKFKQISAKAVKISRPYQINKIVADGKGDGSVIKALGTVPKGLAEWLKEKKKDGRLCCKSGPQGENKKCKTETFSGVRRDNRI